MRFSESDVEILTSRNQCGSEPARDSVRSVTMMSTVTPLSRAGSLPQGPAPGQVTDKKCPYLSKRAFFCFSGTACR
ncbi:hypothetical protein DZG01_04855 [Pseudomonas fluorescens]|nr:hypothetical protein DZG01_04855 [Pseudomonas fluorescens]